MQLHDMQLKLLLHHIHLMVLFLIILSLILTLPGLLIAMTFHEYAHAYAAVKLGDDTPRMQGRLSLNPLAHLDPVGSVLLLFTGIGWGKQIGRASCRERV